MRNENKSKLEKDTIISKKLISKMTLEEKIGQMFQVGFVGTKVTSGISEMIKDYHIGGIIYFRRNIKSLRQVFKLSNELQAISINQRVGLPLMISTDQEGGIVHRLIGGTHFPGSMVLGATKKAELAERMGQAIAKELKTVGINMDFAPVLDVNCNSLNPAIGVRSFGEDPFWVAKLGVAFIKGVQAEGVIACGKHFPGHGDTVADSHLTLPVVKHDRNHLEKVEFYPFMQAIQAGVDSIMTAHVCFPSIEPKEDIPATLSYNVLTNLLRKELGYTGIIITDCMEMKAIADGFGTSEGAIMSIKAGSDIVLVSHSINKQKQAMEMVVEAVRKGEISEERINQSVLRILRLKKKRICLKTIIGSNYQKINKKMDEELAYQIAKKGVTLVKDESNLIPIDMFNSKKILVLDFFLKRSSLVEDDIENENLLVDFLREEGVEVKHYTFFEGKDTMPSLEGIDRIIVCSFNAIHNPYQVKIIRKIQTLNIPFIVLSSNPYDLQAFSEVSTFLTTYDYSPFNLQVASEIIVGKYKAQGILPVTLKF
ncbi:Beta-hexosaminidase [subsurface metagenome]|jgi:beta-N-acetylhexosaminidase